MERWLQLQMVKLQLKKREHHRQIKSLVWFYGDGKLQNNYIIRDYHYDIWDALFKQHPEMLDSIPLPKELITEQYVLGIIKKNVEEMCPNTRFFTPEHHTWYRFGLSCEKVE